MSCCGALSMLRPAPPPPASEPAARRPPPDTDLADMVRVDSGVFLMGYDGPDTFLDDGEGPVREVTLSPFLVDATAVSNAQFESFVLATGYVTDAESAGWSFVFHRLLHPAAKPCVQDVRLPEAPWWLAVDQANWRQPEGPGSDLNGRADHPVVHVSWRDASSYAVWRGRRLPTEAEWECAARGGLARARYPWGDDLRPGGEHRCNLWQGRFPDIDTAEDGFAGTCPVGAFAPNALGLFNMAGNVWEWCSDWWSPFHHFDDCTSTRRDPHGPPAGSDKVIRGGSYLCHAAYCNRYRVSARHHNGVTASTGHMGFRCAADAD